MLTFKATGRVLERQGCFRHECWTLAGSEETEGGKSATWDPEAERRQTERLRSREEAKKENRMKDS